MTNVANICKHVTNTLIYSNCENAEADERVQPA